MNSAFSQKENYYNAVYLNIIFDGRQIFLNKNKNPNISLDSEAPSLDIQGPYIVEFYKENNELSARFNTNIKLGENSLFLPWVLNAKYLVFKDKNGNNLGKIDISEFLVCNENKKCEPNEVYLCPLDCKTAKNPYYPFTQEIISKPIQQETLPTPLEVYNQIFLYSIFGLILTLIIVLIIYLRRK